MLYIEDYAVVNSGIKKSDNEDNICINSYTLSEHNEGLSNYEKKINSTKNNLVYAVYDGIGGLDNGQLASYVGVSNLCKNYGKESISNILNNTNDILNKMNKEQNISMGTTASVVSIKNNELIINQIGDSPIYILSNDKFTKYVQKENNGNLVDNYLGKDNELIISENKIKIKENDKIIVCSDGLSNQVGELEIEYILSASNDVKFITNKLLNYALLNGGNDNISIITLIVKKPDLRLIYIIIGMLMLLMISLCIIIL